MSQYGYGSSSSKVRSRLEAMVSLPDDAEQWASFLRQETRLPLWILPALREAIRQGDWRTSADPVSHITHSVRHIAIGMQLSHPVSPAVEVDEEE